MIAIDTNLLVYAHRRDAEWHQAAREAIAGLAEGSSAWAIPWPCLHEFLAIVTHARIYRPPTVLPQALAQVDAWLESPSLVLLSESDIHWQTLRVQVAAGHATGPRVHDARVASLCIAHGVREFWSADRDFSRFPGLRVRNPLVSAP